MADKNKILYVSSMFSVDKDYTIIKIIQNRTNKFDFDHAYDTYEALNNMRSKKYNCVLIGCLKLPPFNESVQNAGGLSLAEYIKKIKDLPVIVLTEDIPLILEEAKNKADKVFEIPCKPDKIIQALEEICENREIYSNNDLNIDSITEQ